MDNLWWYFINVCYANGGLVLEKELKYPYLSILYSLLSIPYPLSLRSIEIKNQVNNIENIPIKCHFFDLQNSLQIKRYCSLFYFTRIYTLINQPFLMYVKHLWYMCVCKKSLFVIDIHIYTYISIQNPHWTIFCSSPK